MDICATMIDVLLAGYAESIIDLLYVGCVKAINDASFDKYFCVKYLS